MIKHLNWIENSNDKIPKIPLSLYYGKEKNYNGAKLTCHWATTSQSLERHGEIDNKLLCFDDEISIVTDIVSVSIYLLSTNNNRCDIFAHM